MTGQAQHIPVRVIVRFLGFPQEDADSFRRFIRLVLEDVDLPPEERETRFADRDPGAFEDPDLVQLDRAKNRHAAFGLGRHRCLGSNLARMKLRVALEEWLARYPDFELADPSAVTWSGGQVRGPRTLPVNIL
jgi:cytochrome P450